MKGLRLGLVVLLAAAAFAGAQTTRMLVADQMAFIQEDFPPSGQRDIQEIVFENPPEGLDTATLQVWGPKAAWDMAEWGFDGNAIRIRLASPMSHLLGHTLSYRVHGWSWRVAYHLTWDAAHPSSAGLAAILHVKNPSGRAYPDATVSLRNLNIPPQTENPFRRFDLNEGTPLSDVWLNPTGTADDIPMVYVYPREFSASLPAQAETEVTWFSTPALSGARPVYQFDQASPGIFPAAPGTSVALRQHLRIPNTAENGMGHLLPAGRLHWRDTETTLRPVAFPGELDIPLGDTTFVHATRAKRGTPIRMPDGNRMLSDSITFTNQLDTEATVVFLEKPATPFTWTVESSNVSDLQIEGDVLRFQFTIPPKDRFTVSYRLVLTIPPVDSF